MIFEHVSPALIVLLTLALGCGASLIARALGKSAGWALAVLPLVSSILWLLAAGDGDTVLRSSWAWADNLGVNWDTWLSPLGLLLAVLVSGIGLLITLYAAAYLKGSPRSRSFFAFLFLFMGAMLGIAITENLLVLFVFWEMTSITSYLLIGFYHSKIESRKSALDALLITGGGGPGSAGRHPAAG
jgi:multicomponent Na+:H+ antiporter subunit A